MMRDAMQQKKKSPEPHYDIKYNFTRRRVGYPFQKRGITNMTRIEHSRALASRWPLTESR